MKAFFLDESSKTSNDIDLSKFGLEEETLETEYSALLDKMIRR